MKKIVVCFSLLAGIALTSYAQKGTILLYGNLGIHSVKEPDDDKHTFFSAYPGVGYQFSDRCTAGINGGFGHEKFSPSSGSDSKSDSYRAGGFFRYTYAFNSIFSLFGQGDVYYHGNKIDEVKSNGFGIDAIPTIGITVAKGFFLNISFGGIAYETIKIKDADNSTKTFDFNFGKEITIGVSGNIGKKK